ncbi:hypothetical protein COV11_04285 [Candidatus Woesearchaeota archaeon CG10_big_fil_rev_8_21_14_0_10_30_7]|nr:MAG: hypothetical protein COV11_04285 [Candidatus Woesearchaeota archaeon CG10_big_fil_rev_8_21_14_0_10_30_7]
MVLAVYDWIYGSAQLAAFFLAIIAAIIAADLFHHSKKKLMPWRYFLAAMILFSLWEILGALENFNIIQHTIILSILPSIFLALLIISLIMQILAGKGWLK